MREGEEVFEGCVAVGICAEYLMPVSPAHRVHTPGGVGWCFAALKPDGDEELNLNIIK